MKSLKLYGKRDIRYEEATKPAIEKQDDVIVKVKAVGICGSDISRYMKLGPYEEGMIFGHEFSGVVEKVGRAVVQLKPGDRVTGCPALYCGKCESCKKSEYARCEKLTVIGSTYPGAFAEYVKLPAENFVKIPADVDFDAASMVEPSSVVIHGLYKTMMHPGAEVAIMGSGNIGLLAVQWANIFGAKKIYAIDIDNEKLAIAKALGASATINPKDGPVHEQLMTLTEGRGVDVAVEAAGSIVTSAQVFSLCKKGGSVVFLGIPYGDVNVERFYFEKIVRNELKVYGSWNAISAPFPGKEWETSLQFMASGQLKVDGLITHRLSLKEGPEIFEQIANKVPGIGKVIFYPEI
ncbi:L-iditol 2-dehydrogenase [Streptohalobacillus salinus]|uniref:L-iditol 2-dehydrogenase n=1 Tax=Streptohalobacillus salinus TaxID=621096 RepID=A0A2V3W0V7_9BACI|nr:galactitol-1-phosphate 5-dehydrogenase [Streptohalobacillus salinus]PXW86718.1 L-iditol 2-dehydrogenase [Streptohalobacillus salinus]